MLRPEQNLTFNDVPQRLEPPMPKRFMARLKACPSFKDYRLSSPSAGILWISNDKCASSEGWHEQWVKVPPG